MASAKSSGAQVPRVHHFELVDRIQLQINVSGSSNGCNVRVDFQLKNCTSTWILHWGCVYHGNKNWFIPGDHLSGTNTLKLGALQTPFTKKGDLYVITVELRDPRIHAIEFVLKDGSRDRWLKLNNGNFSIEIPQHDANPPSPIIPKELIERRAYLIWESKGRPASSPEQQKRDYDAALRELQNQLSKGASLKELNNSSVPGSPVIVSSRVISENREQVSNGVAYSYNNRKHDVGQWLQRPLEGQVKNSSQPSSTLMNLVEKYMGGYGVVSRQSYDTGSYYIVILTKVVKGDNHILIATNTKGASVLHWGVSMLSPGEWLEPPPELLPQNSKLVTGACQTYFTEISAGEGFFQVVDINLQQRNFVGVQFVIWSGGSWIKNNGGNFFAGMRQNNPSGKVDMGRKGIVKWLLDEISHREKEAERSLMHRYNIATELTDRCKSEGELALAGILVWLRFMSCRHLTWNKNYNVKPREISEAQDRFTSLLHRIFVNQPNDREIVRLIMTCVGRGGQGDVGQRIRDEILVIQRNNDCKGGMMEEWHQKLHNNSSPDDVIICEALLNYVKSGCRVDVYWQTLNSNGLTKAKLASYDRPIVSEPHFRTDSKEGLLRDLTAYLKTLKAVHSGVDLESAIDSCISGLSSKLQECLHFVKAHVGDESISALMEKLLESRIQLRLLLLTSHGRSKDLLFLDLALASTVRTAMERGLKYLNIAQPPEIMFFISLLLENMSLSTVNNEDLIFCTKDWYRICESYKPSNDHWALQTKAVLDRLRLVLGDRSEHYLEMIQPSAIYLGKLLAVDKWAIDIFAEELIRSGSASALSTLINRFDPILRKMANLGCWQVISPVEVSGSVASVNNLISVQKKVYRKPTVLIANKVTGEEEIPTGVVAVLTPDMPDVLSHISIRARNSKVCFATCFDQNVLQDLKSKEGKTISIRINLTDLIISDISSSNLSRNSITSFKIPRALTLSLRAAPKKKVFRGKYALSIGEFTSDTVGAKSCNIQYLRGRVPSWIRIPESVALPFGVFETVLSEDFNRDIANKISCFNRHVQGGDLSKLKAIQETVLQMKASLPLINELKNKMISSRIPWPGDEGEERWNCAWQAIKKVWASKWNERAYVSCKKVNMNHDNLCMAVLIQEVISADYAFVIHTKNPLSGDTSEIYTEIVKGLGETLVGAYPGRAMSFITKKKNLQSPIVMGYPSKKIGLYVKRSIIFRSDSNGEDLEGYAGAGLYDSAIMDKEEKVMLDYSSDRMVTDNAFRTSLFSRIANAGKIIEDLYGLAQDIEGVVKDEVIYVVQARPQV